MSFISFKIKYREYIRTKYNATFKRSAAVLKHDAKCQIACVRKVKAI